MGLEINRKPINYGRGGEGHIDLEAAALANRDKSIKRNLPEKKQEEFYDLAGELKAEVEAETELSAVEIKAITEELRSQFAAIEGAVKNAKYPGLDSETIKKLESEAELIKKMALDSSGITEEVYSEKESDSVEMKREKAILRTAVEYVKQL